MPRLRRSDCSGPGIVRRRRGRGFEYLDADGERVEDDDVLERIRELVIPPAWVDVWICPYPFGHIQAVGTDAAGRRQYLYHEHWRLRRDQEKFDDMLRFARALPGIRRTATRHLALRGFSRERVLACSVRLLDRGFFRVGTEDYAEQHGTYGLATMEKRHVTLGPNGLLVFDYVAKSRKQHVQSIVDPEVYAVVKKLKARRRGTDLLAFKDGRTWVDVRSDHINDYIKETSGEDFSAKDFRTWHGTVLAAVALAVSGRAAGSKTARERAISRAVKEASHYLGNTRAVCRASYIDPRVFDRYRDGVTIGGALDRLGDVDPGEPATQGAVEEAVLDLLEESESPAFEKVA
jgi:DNA topoisomerase IB